MLLHLRQLVIRPETKGLCCVHMNEYYAMNGETYYY